MINYSKSYREVNVSTQRKPPPQIGAPAVTQHFAFWQPVDASKESWHKSIDYLLFKIFMIVWSDNADRNPEYIINSNPAGFNCQSFSPRDGKVFFLRNSTKVRMSGNSISDFDDGSYRELEVTPLNERNSRYEYFYLSAPFRNIYLSIRAELRSEFWTLTLIGDFSRALPNSKSNFDYTQILNAFNFIQDHAVERIKRNFDEENIERTSDETSAELLNAGNVLYENFRKLIDREILTPCYTNFPCTDLININNVGGIFADFRGLVLGVLAKRRSKTDNKIGFDYMASDLDISWAKANDDPSKTKSTIHTMLEYVPYEKGLDLRIVDSLWPAIKRFFMTSQEIEEYQSITSSKPDFTASRFQHGRSIYISSLGRLDNKNVTDNQPVRYLLIVGYKSRWQLGRLVERIHSLGTLRLAAVWDIVNLIRCSDALRDLISRWQQMIHRNDLNKTIDVSGEIDRLGASIHGGLLFRVQRSKYYVSLFKKVLKDSRLSRIEGFQPYDQFVRRRVGATFSSIQRLGARYQELRREVKLVLERQRTEQITKLHESSLKIQEGIRNIQQNTDKSVEELGKNKELLINFWTALSTSLRLQ